MALGPVLAAALTNHGAHPYGLYVGGLDVIAPTGAGYGVDVTTISLTEAAPDAVSSMAFTVQDPTSQVALPVEGSEVAFFDLANDWILFRGSVETVDLMPRYGGNGRDIAVTATGIEAWLDWAVLQNDYTVNNVSLREDVDFLLNGGPGITRPTFESPVRCMVDPAGAAGSSFDQPTAPDYPVGFGLQTGNIQLGAVVPAGTTMREALRQVVAAHGYQSIAADPTLGFEEYITLDFWFGLRMWNGDGTSASSTYTYQVPTDYPTLTISDTTAGTHATGALSYTIDYGDEVHDVYVKGANAAGSGYFSDGTGQRGRQAVVNADSTDATGARQAASAYFAERVVGTRGTLTLTDWAPDDQYRAGSLLVITDANVGLSGSTFRIFDISKSFLSNGRQTWSVSFGGPRPSGVRLIRRLTRDTLD